MGSGWDVPIPDAHVVYRDGQVFRFVGWMPENIRARGVSNPWGQFFADWLEVLELESRVTRITTAPEA